MNFLQSQDFTFGLDRFPLFMLGSTMPPLAMQSDDERIWLRAMIHRIGLYCLQHRKMTSFRFAKLQGMGDIQVETYLASDGPIRIAKFSDTTP
jgi:hypothetical protein